jgi:hypothetical protein
MCCPAAVHTVNDHGNQGKYQDDPIGLTHESDLVKR